MQPEKLELRGGYWGQAGLEEMGVLADDPVGFSYEVLRLLCETRVPFDDKTSADLEVAAGQVRRVYTERVGPLVSHVLARLTSQPTGFFWWEKQGDVTLYCDDLPGYSVRFAEEDVDPQVFEAWKEPYRTRLLGFNEGERMLGGEAGQGNIVPAALDTVKWHLEMPKVLGDSLSWGWSETDSLRQMELGGDGRPFVRPVVRWDPEEEMTTWVLSSFTAYYEEQVELMATFHGRRTQMMFLRFVPDVGVGKSDGYLVKELVVAEPGSLMMHQQKLDGSGGVEQARKWRVYRMSGVWFQREFGLDVDEDEFKIPVSSATNLGPDVVKLSYLLLQYVFDCSPTEERLVSGGVDLAGLSS